MVIEILSSAPPIIIIQVPAATMRFDRFYKTFRNCWKRRIRISLVVCEHHVLLQRTNSADTIHRFVFSWFFARETYCIGPLSAFFKRPGLAVINNFLGSIIEIRWSKYNLHYNIVYNNSTVIVCSAKPSNIAKTRKTNQL